MMFLGQWLIVTGTLLFFLLNSIKNIYIIHRKCRSFFFLYCLWTTFNSLFVLAPWRILQLCSSNCRSILSLFFSTILLFSFPSYCFRCSFFATSFAINDNISKNLPLWHWWQYSSSDCLIEAPFLFSSPFDINGKELIKILEPTISCSPEIMLHLQTSFSYDQCSPLACAFRDAQQHLTTNLIFCI